MMGFVFKAAATAGLILVLFMMPSVHAGFGASVYVGDQLPPQIVSVKTYTTYQNDANNNPSTSFFYPDTRIVHVQVKVSDDTGYNNVVTFGYVKVKIVLWDGATESEFPRFGPDYMNAIFESGGGNQAIYTFSYSMSASDQVRTGKESPALYYRVKAQVSNGLSNTTSNLTSGNADYTYDIQMPPGPQVLFDVTISVPENKKIVAPADSFYATVAIKKVSPPGQDDIIVSYEILDPLGRRVDYLIESLAINDTLYRVPVLFIPVDASPGYYVFRATVSYQDVNSLAEVTFQVIQRPPGTSTTTTAPATTTTPGSTTSTNPYETTTTSTTASTTTTLRRGGGGGGGAGVNIPIQLPEQIRQISLYKYPDEIYGFKGEEKPVMVVVENTGDLPLDGVTVFMAGPLEVTKVVPESIDGVEAGARKVFVLTISIPEDLAAGTYDVTLKAIAQHATDEKHIKLTVIDRPYGASREMDLKKKIEDLDALVKAIWNEAVEVGIGNDDKNILEVFRVLKSAQDGVQKARNSWQDGRYDATEAALAETRGYIENSVVSLAYLKSGKNKTEVKEVVSTKESTVYVLPPIFWAIAGIAVASFLLLVYQKSRKEKPGRKLEELYELRRTKDLVLGRIRGQ